MKWGIIPFKLAYALTIVASIVMAAAAGLKWS
jgi:hypothetical protein